MIKNVQSLKDKANNYALKNLFVEKYTNYDIYSIYSKSIDVVHIILNFVKNVL